MRSLGTRLSSIFIILVTSVAGTGYALPGTMTKEDQRKQQICGKGELLAKELPQFLSDMPCDLTGKMVVDGSVGALIPRRDLRVSAQSIELGGSSALTIETSADGTVEIIKEPFGSQSREPATQAAPNACSDPAYTLWGHRVANLPWKYTYGQEPRGFTIGTVVEELRKAVNNIDGRQTDCRGFGNAPIAKARPAYSGTTPFRALISPDNRCLGSDKSTEVDWIEFCPPKTLEVLYLAIIVRTLTQKLA